MRPFYFFFILLLVPLYFCIIIIRILVISFIDSVKWKKARIKCAKNNIRIILYVANNNELDIIKNLMMLNDNFRIIFLDSITDCYEHKMYYYLNLHKIYGPIIVLAHKNNFEVIKLYSMIHIKKNRLKKIRKITKKIDNVLK